MKYVNKRVPIYEQKNLNSQELINKDQRWNYTVEHRIYITGGNQYASEYASELCREILKIVQFRI